MILIIVALCSFLFGWKASKKYFMVAETSIVLRVLSKVMSGEMTQEEAKKEMDKINLN